MLLSIVSVAPSVKVNAKNSPVPSAGTAAKMVHEQWEVPKGTGHGARIVKGRTTGGRVGKSQRVPDLSTYKNIDHTQFSSLADRDLYAELQDDFESAAGDVGVGLPNMKWELKASIAGFWDTDKSGSLDDAEKGLLGAAIKYFANGDKLSFIEAGALETASKLFGGPDGKIDADEAADMDALLKLYDADNSGGLDEKERMGAVEFAKAFNKDGKGGLDPNERKVMMAVIETGKRIDGSKAGQKLADFLSYFAGAFTGEEAIIKQLAKKITEADADGDGVLSSEEMDKSIADMKQI